MSVRHLVFQNFVKWPIGNLSNPSEYNLKNVHNFYIESDAHDQVRLGVWHFIPDTYKYDADKDSLNSNQKHLQKFVNLNDDVPIIVYVHGNDRDRATPFRLELCNNLVKIGYHVFAIDYRGYGDSTGTPSEIGVVSDTIAIYNLIKAHKPNSKLFLYGHSLGTGIVSHAGKVLSENNQKIDGVILEAPFLNAKQASKDYVISPLFLNNKWIQGVTEIALDHAHIHFSTDKNILKINSKIIIFHGQDDWFIPVTHSRELIKICKADRPKSYPPIRLIEVDAEHKLGHFLAWHAPIYLEIKKFVESN